MSLTPGTRLGPYEILSPLGAGGMGEVYRAKDTRLDRDVAVKVLPEAFARDPERLARFEREAKAVAALSHPNILAIFDFGVEHGVAYSVTELLDGETLRARLAAGAVPVRKAIDIATQMLRGLAAAHDKGIIHRDVKPENVVVLPDGQVKILDFGLARQTAPAGDAAATVAVTDPGTVLGTVGYMAPEQIRGQAIDARADLFALGAVLFEMLSGRRAFQRDTAADTLSAVLGEDPPDLAGSRPDFSPALDRIVRHCLEKNPAERFQSARDVAFALQALSGAATAAQQPATERRRPRWLAAAVVVAIAVAVSLAGGYWAGRRAAGSPNGTSVRFQTKTFEPLRIYNARFAPDGETIVYSAAVEPGVPGLFVLRQGSALPQPVGRRRMHLLSVSSTGELAVLTDATFINHRVFTGTLARMTMDGEPRPWMDSVREADWSPDGSTLAVVRAEGGQDRLEYPIGHVLYEATGYLSDPRVSPDGTRVAFMDHRLKWDDRGWVKVADRDGRVTTLTDEFWGEQGLAWAPDGQTVYFSGATPGSESYQPMAVSTGTASKAREVLSSIGAVILLDLARDGRWLVTRMDEQASIRALLPGESAEREFPWLNAARLPSLSKDGKLLVFSDQSQSAGPNYAVAMRRVDGSPAVRLGEGASLGISPDGKWALGGVFDPGRLVVYPTGTGAPVELNHGPIARFASGGWFPDSRRIVICGNEASKPVRCYELSLAGGLPKPLTPEQTTNGSVSPDGTRITARFSDGGFRTWLLAGGEPTPVATTTHGDILVGWTADSRGLLLQTPDIPAHLDRVDVQTGKRTLVRVIAPSDRAGVEAIVIHSALGNGEAYAYSYKKILTTLFTVTGAR